MARTFMPWFEEPPARERRLAKNRLRRIATISQEQEDSQIQRWLDLGDQALKDSEAEQAPHAPRKAA